MTPLPDLATMCERLLAAHNDQPGIVGPDALRFCRLITEHKAYTVTAIPDAYILTIAEEYRRLGPWHEDRGLGDCVDIDTVHHHTIAARERSDEPIHVPAFLRATPAVNQPQP